MEIKFFIKILFLLFSINKISNKDCSKNEPILYGEGNCTNRYCTNEEFENETCKFNNSIAQTQWLNKINTFMTNNVVAYTFLRMSNNDIFFFSIVSDDDEYLYIYGLKSNGENYYNDKSGGDYLKINFPYFSSFNIINLKIDDKEYPLICSYELCSIIDLDTGECYVRNIQYFFKGIDPEDRRFKKIPFSFPIINLNQDNKILFIIFFGIEDLVFNFGISNISKDLNESQPLENVYNGTKFTINPVMERLHCFITEKKFIECSYYESDIYKVAIFGENYNYIDSITLDDNEIEETLSSEYRMNSNCIHLKKEIGIFTYYNKVDGCPTAGLILQINELLFNGTNYVLKPLYEDKKIILTLDINTFLDQNDINNDSIDLKDLKKINDNKFAYIYDYFTKDDIEEPNIVLVIFDLYGSQNEILLIKYYQINHNYILGYYPFFFYKINIITFNSFMGIAFVSLKINDDSEIEDEINPYYIIFGNSVQNINEIEFNVTGTLVWNIKENFTITIDNNLFGYELQYKILSIDNSLENIKIFSINNSQLSENDTLGYDDILLFDFTNINIKVENHPIVEIVAKIFEPDYSKSIEFSDKMEYYPNGGDINKYYEQKLVDEKVLKLKFNFECYITCESCEYVGFNITEQKCSSCKNSDTFCLMKNEGNCYEINELSSHYNYYLDPNNGNQLICLSEERDESDEIDGTEQSDGAEQTNESNENDKSDESDENSEYPSESEKNGDYYNQEFNYDDIINKNVIVSNNPENYTKVIDILYNKIKEGSLDEVINKEIIINGINITIQATTTLNEKYLIENNINTNLSVIDFTECEKKMGFDKPIIILKMDIKNNGSFAPQVEYFLINPHTYEKIDLSIFENNTIDIYIPFDISKHHLDLYNYAISQGYNIFNPSDSFYKDVCTPFNSENKTDVLITDRKKDYFTNEYAFCEEGCNFENINIDLNKVKCNCQIKKEMKTDTKFSTSKLFGNFYKIDSYSNFKILICFNLAFSSIGLKNNYGCYILSTIIFLFISTTVINLITYTKKVNELLEAILERQEKLINISTNKNNQNHNKNELRDGKNDDKEEKPKISQESNNKLKTIKKKKKKKKKKIKKTKIQENIIKDAINNNKNFDNSEKREMNQENNIIKYLPKKDSTNSLRALEISCKSKEELMKSKIDISVFVKKDNSAIVKTENDKNEKVIDFIINNIEKEKRKNYFNNEELNSLEYKYALEIDDRTYMKYYWSLLKLKHLIIFTFISNDDYNIFLLKLGFFFISCSLYFAVNGMFFSDDSIHKQYEDKGKYNFLYQIPKILYSTIISAITNLLLKKLSLSQKDISKLKHNLDINKAKESSENIKKCLKIKFMIFILVGFILLCFFWYYLSCFCSVFVNTQIPLLKDTIISYGLSMIYPFGLNLFPGLLRIPSLKKDDRKIIYIISKIIAFI